MSLLTLEAARANRLTTDWDTLEIAVPWFIGRRVVSPPLDELVPLVVSASELHGLAQTTLTRIVGEKRLIARGVYGFWPSNADGDDVVVYKDDARRIELARFHMLRQQEPVADGAPSRSLADFIAPRDSFAPDYVGAFAVTVGIGVDELVRECEAVGDDLGAIAVKMIAERLAEALAEHVHRQARHDWGYASGEHLTNDELVAGKYRGLRVVFGGSTCPDRTENTALFRLLNASEVGMQLTDAHATIPAASVSGLYFSHPAARHCDVGRIGRDQVEDYARRKGVSVEDAERWLVPNLG